MQSFVNKLWYPSNKASLMFTLLRYFLLPLSVLFFLVSTARRYLFKVGVNQAISLSVPVIIVGNITVGGSGKTPTVIYLIELLRKQGLRPGVISRGYGVEFDGVRVVEPGMDTSEVGDEPAMIVARTGVAMVIGADRVSAAKQLINRGDVDVIISDDGLQHYKLERDIELVILDGERRLGNGALLPAGPLREGAWRMESVDFVIVNGEAHHGEYQMTLAPSGLKSVAPSSLSIFEQQTAIAIAGIGNPQRFFNTLAQEGYVIDKTHAFDDHQAYTAEVLSQVVGDAAVLMTEKDAVKCRDFAKDNWWYLAVDAKLSSTFESKLMDKVHSVIEQKKGKSDGI